MNPRLDRLSTFLLPLVEVHRIHVDRRYVENKLPHDHSCWWWTRWYYPWYCCCYLATLITVHNNWKVELDVLAWFLVLLMFFSVCLCLFLRSTLIDGFSNVRNKATEISSGEEVFLLRPNPIWGTRRTSRRLTDACHVIT
jgi:hypothetical protein